MKSVGILSWSLAVSCVSQSSWAMSGRKKRAEGTSGAICASLSRKNSSTGLSNLKTRWSLCL